jgi:CRISPR type III-A-associated protein Csm2
MPGNFYNRQKSPLASSKPRQGGGGQRGPGGGRPFPQQSAESQQQITEKILAGDGATIVQKASELAYAIKGLKTAQIRNFYGSVLLIEEKTRSGGLKAQDFINKIQLLRPKLHYMVNRPQGYHARPLQEFLDQLIPETGKKVNQMVQGQTGDWRGVAEAFFDFLEAIVAYHKEGGA